MTTPFPEPSVVRVLVVDDDEDLRTVIGNILTMYGWSVTMASGVTEALAAVRKTAGAHQLCILDLVLDDEIGGLALADLLHRLQPDAGFLFISGYVDSGVPEEALRGVPTAFLGKPFSVSRLIDEARRLLQ